MVRAVYRWRVKAGEEEKFIQAWTQGTAAIRAKVIGAGGSLLMRSRHDRSEFMALACWNSIEDWQAFAAENDSALPDPEAFRAMGAISEHLSTEILDLQRSWRRSRTSWTVVHDLAYKLHSRSTGTLWSYSEERACVATYRHIYWLNRQRFEGEVMADRPQGTTQEPGRTPSADRSSDTREQLRDRGTQVQERAQEMGAQARDWAQEKGSQIKEGTQEAMRQVGASASQLAEMGRDTMNQLEEGFEDRIRNKPLQSVLIAAGVGMLLGLLWKR